MPFAAFCLKCKQFLVGEKLCDISPKLVEHFRNTHKTFIVHSLPTNMNDFENNLVELWHEPESADNSLADILLHDAHTTQSRPHPFTFQSQIFCSEDYCIAVITGPDYDDCVRFLKGLSRSSKTQEESDKPYQNHLSYKLSNYFIGYV